MLVFIDESGLSERPTRVRTWAPRGQTPVLQYHFNWNQLSVIAGCVASSPVQRNFISHRLVTLPAAKPLLFL
jgi:hypothetical protein